ncbi:uncharacterized protein Z518_03284 [Rhinocladiella mackenziei CBS 650.93]|uniref:NUC153 domain-containing protein n=1 Tax=Rhinocladiella mackenziei CBS 650.93 TaxID=1442369 RepID=A0A0D2HDL4_9EURO|nr:uncharacterized protein Z518_03284 [Rhinocladiella mackenziei CBS 650.93]KIX08628.1 hypothetical protein Z518_03284 [Rhinocladiella mackenziei CBS 650.93]
MDEPRSKKQKIGANGPKIQSGPRITDPRFANIQSDPRYRLPGKKNKVKLDKRFNRVLQDEDFTRRAKVDRYGRPLDSNVERNRLKRKYEFNEEEDDETDEADDDDEVQKELKRVERAHDPLREGRETGSSSEETSSDEESDEEAGVGPAQQTDVPTGEVTSRIAIVNLDWDNIRAADLMAVFNSFLPSNGSLLKVSIYPSEFGKERMEREEMEGPPKEIFANGTKDDRNQGSEDEDEDIKKSILQPDDGADFDSAALRRYQLERLRYFYGILTFSSPSVAKHIYDAVDGTEYLRTANFFDLRFVPEDTDFSTDAPREECDRIPDDYRPNDFVTDALQHSKVKLTWDAEDGSRKEAVARAFKGGQKEIDENDLKAYLGSDSSEDEDVERHEGSGPSMSKKEAERQRMRALLGLAPEPEKTSRKKTVPVGDMQITFTSGLTAANGNGKKRFVFENSPEPEETTLEKYVRKERERKQKRKEKMKAAREGRDLDVDADDTANADAEAGEGKEDLGFDDPFFADADAQPSAKLEKAASHKMRKEERLKKKKEREAEEEAERKQRAELELLMADDDGGTPAQPQRIRHFDMKEIEKAEKQARKKEKRDKNKNKKGQHDDNEANKGIQDEDGFKIDTSDPRFARLFSSHEYAIDPTNPRFKGTKGMKALLEEGRKRKQKDLDSKKDASNANVKRTTGNDKRSGDKAAKATGSGVDGVEDVKRLVEKIKRQNQSQKEKQR